MVWPEAQDILHSNAGTPAVGVQWARTHFLPACTGLIFGGHFALAVPL